MSDSSRHLPQELLSAYLDDELGVDERAEVDHHLALCESCRDDLASLRRLAGVLADEAVPPVPADLAARVGARIDAAKVLPFRRRLVVPVSIAATVAAVGLLIVYRWSNPGPVPSVSSSAGEENLQPPAQDERGAQLGYVHSPPTPATEPKENAVGARQDRFAPEVPPSTTQSAAVTDALDRKEKAASETRGAGVGSVRGIVDGGATEEADRLKKDEPLTTPAVGRVAAQAPTPPPVAGKSALRERESSPCGDRWVDAGVQGTWVVGDMQTALRDLEALAAHCGGRGSAEPVGRGEPYEIVVPKDRYPELVKLLLAKGVTGMEPPAAPPAGDACIRQRVAIQVILGSPPR